MRLLRHTTALMAGLLLSAAAQAVEPTETGYVEYTDKPGYYAMVGDLIIARPLLAGVTAIGAAAFVVSLPFTLLAGNTAEAGQELVVRRVGQPSCVAWVAPRTATAASRLTSAADRSSRGRDPRRQLTAFSRVVG